MLFNFVQTYYYVKYLRYDPIIQNVVTSEKESQLQIRFRLRCLSHRSGSGWGLLRKRPNDPAWARLLEEHGHWIDYVLVVFVSPDMRIERLRLEKVDLNCV